MTYLLAEVSALVNAQPLTSVAPVRRTWKDRQSVAGAQVDLQASDADILWCLLGVQAQIAGLA